MSATALTPEAVQQAARAFGRGRLTPEPVELRTKARKAVDRGLRSVAVRLREEQRHIRGLERQLSAARRRRAQLVAKLTAGDIAERAIAAIVSVHPTSVHHWKQPAAPAGKVARRAPCGVPLTVEQYHLVFQLLREPLTAGELVSRYGGSVQARTADLRRLLDRGWVDCDTGIYTVTGRARKAVSW